MSSRTTNEAAAEASASAVASARLPSFAEALRVWWRIGLLSFGGPAGQIALLDTVSRGRAYLGLVKGAWLDRLGIRDPRPLAALRESVAIVRALLAGDDSGVAGERFTLVPGTTLAYPRFREAVPLLVGTWGRATASWAGTVADEVKVGGAGLRGASEKVVDRGRHSVHGHLAYRQGLKRA